MHWHYQSLYLNAYIFAYMYLHLDLRLCGHLEVSHISKKLLTSKKQSSELRDWILGHRCAEKKATIIRKLLHCRSIRTQWPPSFWIGRSLEQPGLFLELTVLPNMRNLGKESHPETRNIWSFRFSIKDGGIFLTVNQHCRFPRIWA